MNRLLARMTAFVLVLLLAASVAAAAQSAAGVVFHDIDRDGIRSPNEPGIRGVRVSNGRDITTTDADGRYSISADDDTIIFVIKPRGWMPPLDSNNLPKFYYIHKPNGSPALRYKGVDPTGPMPESVDFPLYPNEEPDRFQMLMLGDTQPYNQQQVYHLNRDIVQELAGVDAAFGVILGDIVGDNLSLYDSLVPAMGLVGIPWFNVKGNHDTNYDGVPDQDLIDETFERVFGPAYYSFEYGPVHFVVLNNPYFVRPTGYEARLNSRQMAFLRSDLRLLPQDQFVVLLMHIPIDQMKDRDQIYRLLEDRPNTLSFSAHTHTHYHLFIGEQQGFNAPKPHHHVVNVTSCGSWWNGWPDDRALPISTMSDGAPNGYSIVTFDVDTYSIKYKAAGRPADYQMRIHAPDLVKAADANATTVYANVFAGSEKSVVDMRLGDSDEWVKMRKVEQKDPHYERLKELQADLKTKGYGSLPNAGNCKHLWCAELPADPAPGVYMLQVRTTDMFGQTYTGRQVIYVE